jgi:integrase
MARGVGRLPASFKSLKPGLHCDGGGLYLQVSEAAGGGRNRSWIFRFTLAGRVHDMGLGPVHTVSLAEAREQARQCRLLVRQGLDPIEHRNAEIAKNLANARVVVTFDQACAAYIAAHRSSWSNPVHARQWSTTLAIYASPVLGRLSVAEIETPHVRKVLDAIWATKPETAARLRGRIESVLSWAAVAGFRSSGDNPARWRGHLDQCYPSRTKKTVRHQRALAYGEMPALVTELRRLDDVAASALEFLALTGVRASDIRNARCADIDLAVKVWTIPKFSKVGGQHRVPLSTAAVAAYERARALAREIGVGNAESAFPSDDGRRLSDSALWATLGRTGFRDRTSVHGFRASFRSWTMEATSTAWEVGEAALGHATGSKTERAYARSDLFARRAALMQQWGDYLSRSPQQGGGNVVAIGRGA